MQTAESDSNQIIMELKKYIFQEFLEPTKCIAYLVIHPDYSDPIAAIELTAQLHERRYELVNFWVHKDYAHKGVGRWLLDTAIKQIPKGVADCITVTPIRMVRDDLPAITDEELIAIYKKIGFMNSNKMIVKML